MRVTLLACLALAACGGTVAPVDGSTDAPSADRGFTDAPIPDAPGCIDSDGDGHPAIACGGDDCDDRDANRYPGHPEVCDAAGRDDDCDPTTLGPDADGDGFAATTCCNTQTSGSLRCGTDCDDTRATVNPTAAEVCDGIDDNCNSVVDESVCVDECALGTPCGAGLGTCADTFTGYTCACIAGYTGPSVGGPCVDVDECLTGTSNCDDDPAACTNAVGSFTCPCPTGFSGTGVGATGCLLDDPSLSALVPSVGALSPVFIGATTLYTLALAPGTTTVSLTPSVTFPTRATITVGGVAVAPGASSAPITLTGLAVPVTVVVTTESGATRTYTVVVGRGSTYVKAFNTGTNDLFGFTLALSADGSTLAVGAERESSDATGIGGDQTNDAAMYAGAVYVYARAGTTWAQQAYVKASNTEAGDLFGSAVALSADGSTLVVGAAGEDSNAVGVGADPTNNGAGDAGAVYVFTRAGTTWAQQAYVKASNSGAGDQFGSALALSSDGSTLAVGASREASSATGIGGDQTSNGSGGAGAVYAFTRAGTVWSQQAYVKASNTGSGDNFGYAVALSSDGSTLAVGAYAEASNARGIGGDETNNASVHAGAAYVFTRAGAVWSQQAYVKASNTDPSIGTGLGDEFGSTVALSGDGATLAVGAHNEGSNATGVGGDETNESAHLAGAVYVFRRAGTTWSQQAYVKASNTDGLDEFGIAVALSADGATLAVGAFREASGAVGIGGDQTLNFLSYAGATYLFTLSGTTWSQEAYVKASNTGTNDRVGRALALSSDGSTFVMSADGEASNATGIDGDQTNDSSVNAGAVYVF